MTNGSVRPGIARAPNAKKYVATSALVAALGGFLFGFDNIVISGAIRFLGDYFHLGPAQVGWAAGCALVGCVAGAGCAGVTVDLLGLKKGLAICTVLFASSSVGVWAAHSFVQFSIWRIVAGLGIGAASIIAPMYIAEIAPTRHRGRLVTLYQLGIVVGILCAVVSNMLIQRMGSDLWNTEHGWRLMFLVGVFPALIFGLVIFPSLESPRWLMKVGRIAEARSNLDKLNSPLESQHEFDAITVALQAEAGSMLELLTTFRRPLLLGLMLAGLQQISGITPLFSYLPEIFRAAGAATGSAFQQSVLVSVVNLCATLAALPLIDRAGRKTLILWGTSLQALSFIAVGSLYHVHGSPLSILIFVMLFVAGHAFGNGVAMWVIISEIYPAKVRGRAMSIATSMLWLVSYVLNQAFPIMQVSIGPAVTFWLFAGGALMSIVLVAYLVPETKDRSLEEITLYWKGLNAR
jgi:SP family arabinose:H+ symporter-like MFS transporter